MCSQKENAFNTSFHGSFIRIIKLFMPSFVLKRFYHVNLENFMSSFISNFFPLLDQLILKKTLEFLENLLKLRRMVKRQILQRMNLLSSMMKEKALIVKMMMMETQLNQMSSRNMKILNKKVSLMKNLACTYSLFKSLFLFCSP